MNLLAAIHQAFPEEKEDKPMKLLYSDMRPETREEIIYRKNGTSIDRVVEIDIISGSRVKTTHYDYFNDKKIRSIDEYDRKSGKKIRTINYVLYKSIDEYDLNSGKKVRTINFNIKDDTKISSIHEYDVNTGNIVTIFIYKRDGKTVSIIKKIDPETKKVTSWINNSNSSNNINSSKSNKISNSKHIEYKQVETPKVVQPVYNNIKFTERRNKEDIARLIDSLYSNKVKFENIR